MAPSPPLMTLRVYRIRSDGSRSKPGPTVTVRGPEDGQRAAASSSTAFPPCACARCRIKARPIR